MINRNEENQSYALTNEKMAAGFTYGTGFQLKPFIHKLMGQDIKQQTSELFQLDIEGQRFLSSRFDVLEISDASDQTEEMVSVLLTEKSAGITARVCLINHRDNMISLVVQLAVQWQDDGPKEVYLHIPFLADFSLSGSAEEKYYFPANPAEKTNGRSIMQLHEDFNLPLGIFDKATGKGFSIRFPVVDAYVRGWDQKRNHDLNDIASLKQLKNHSILLRPDANLTDIFEMRIEAINDGWIECFNNWREDVRKNVYLYQYEREDLKWYRETYLHHFAFAYGKEIYNYDTNAFEISRLIRQGEEFGGYDAILLWHQYPRLGVDQRSQWDFFDDFPGGKAGIKKTVEEAHGEGVKVFLPFKPWDVGSKECPEGVIESLAELIKLTDIDGVFFDTMNSVPKGLREAIDKVRSGVVFCTEGQPRFKSNIENITGSWDQYWSSTPMPETNLLRYVLPEHFAPIISRWHVGVKKDLLIQRAVFNGTGIVVWQDIFGSWLPYSKKQKDAIRKWKQILSENRQIYLSVHPIPLYPVLKDGLSCNCFPSDCQDSVIYSLYNETDASIEGDLFLHKGHGPVETITEIWNGTEVGIRQTDAGDTVCGSLAAKAVLIIKITSKELLSK